MTCKASGRKSASGKLHRERNNRRARVPAHRGIVSDQTARRRLEDLRAAVNLYRAEHTLDVVPEISLPEKTKGRERWLTRNEAARLLGAAVTAMSLRISLRGRESTIVSA